MSHRIQSIRNYYFPTTKTDTWKSPVGAKEMKRNLSTFISPVQFERIKHSIGMWREAIREMELAWFPQRAKQQRLLQDTILNEHVSACWDRRRNLTLLRDFKICDDKGKGDDDLKKLFRNITTNVSGAEENSAAWFDDFMTFSIDALGFSYSLISLGDLINDGFPQISVIRRQNVSPDRYNVTAYVYSLSGQNFLEKPYVDWHIWVPTLSETGVGKCGYGLFYKIAKAEIFLRNNTQFNADYQESFGQPIRKGKTSKTEESERAEYARMLAMMGSQPWALLDEGDELEIIESKNTGSAYKSYADFEKRQQQNISKVLLGHADAMDSQPDKLGSQQGGEESPVASALDDIQVKDGIFVQNIVNTKLIPRMRKFGFDIPLNFHFEFVNNNEDEEFREHEDDSNQKTANIAVAMKNAGLKMDAKYFQKRTGIPTTEDVPPPLPDVDPADPTDPAAPAKPKDKKKGPALNEKTKARLDKLYGVK